VTASATTQRAGGRGDRELRTVTIEPGYLRHAEGSALISFGDTRVLCAASVESGVPGFLRGTGAGWVTAEYGMLPRATHTRGDREAARGRQSGRTQEIQRLIGRSLRAAVDLDRLGETTIRIDCDVLQADGGTRTASVTGGYVALGLAIAHMQKKGSLSTSLLTTQVGAISVGLREGHLLLDLDYDEDSTAGADVNIVMLGSGRFVELQGTAEGEAFSKEDVARVLELADAGIRELFVAQREALNAS
jgi:ribonuclease PH